ncbi:MAG: glycosyltransferase [Herpetosiphonaceae bacterium]|nr:glycosyltransferase [Herpetosiphonaceae bacterium]
MAVIGNQPLRPLRIAWVSEHASPLALLGSQDAGGQNVYVDEVSRGLAQLGYAVDIFTRRDHADLSEVVAWSPGVRIINLPVGPAQFVPKDQLWPLMPSFRTELEAWSKRAGLRYDLLHGNFWMSGAVVAELGAQLAIPVVQIFHAMGKTKQQHQGAADGSPADRIATETEIIKRVTRVIAQCPAEAAELIDDYGADPHKVVTIPSAVNIERFHPLPHELARQSIGLPPDGLIVAYVGRMMPRKDVRNLVHAMALVLRQTDLPLRLLLVGGETDQPDPLLTPEIGVLQSLAQELGISDHLIFTGKRQPDVLHRYYAAADIIVTTPWYEPFGLTPLEAMACGRPVIGSAVGGIPFTINDGVTGLLVPPRDPPVLAAALLDLLQNGARRLGMGLAARNRVEQLFTWRTVAERTSALYRQLINEQAAASHGSGAKACGSS